MKKTLIAFVLLIGCATLMSACGSDNPSSGASCGGAKVCIKAKAEVH